MSMSLEEIYKQIDAEGFSARTLEVISNFSNDIVNGRTNDRIALEDMHPANVFIDEVSDKPICIDCIVKFVG